MNRSSSPRYGLPLVLFLLTLGSVLWTGAAMVHPPDEPFALSNILDGWVYAVPLLAILVCHEFGHYIAARLHGVPASLPYFLPLPQISFFGTLGAVIVMPERIRSRRALLDIGAAGPIAGMVVAIVVLMWGLTLSEVRGPGEAGSFYIQEGQSILYALFKWLAVGNIPDGQDVWLHPTALAGWAGLFITMINLLPYGQLDGGHIAFALFGNRHTRAAPWIRRSVLLLFAGNLIWFVWTSRLHGTPLELALGNSLFWLVWFGLLSLMRRRMGDAHPPVDGGTLPKGRRLIAWGCLLLFIGLFMPAPLTQHVVPGAAEDSTANP